MKIIETEPKTNNMSRETWNHLYKQLSVSANPQLSALKGFLEAPFQIVFAPEAAKQQKAYKQYMSVLQLKLNGMTHEPSPIEKTMTRAQLFLCDSPLWTIGLRPNAIKTILAEYNKVKRFKKPELIVNIINEAITDYGTVDLWKMYDICKENLY